MNFHLKIRVGDKIGPHIDNQGERLSQGVQGSPQWNEETQLSTSRNRLRMDISAKHHSALRQLLQEQSPFFLGIISSYVARMGLARGDAVGGLALIVWQETSIEALAHVERFARAS